LTPVRGYKRFYACFFASAHGIKRREAITTCRPSQSVQHQSSRPPLARHQTQRVPQQPRLLPWPCVPHWRAQRRSQSTHRWVDRSQSPLQAEAFSPPALPGRAAGLPPGGLAPRLLSARAGARRRKTQGFR